MSTPEQLANMRPPARKKAEAAPSLTDGQWHRMHPMTPLLKGGIVLLVIIGIIISNLRDRIVGWFIRLFGVAGESNRPDNDYNGDPIDWLISNDMVLLGSAVALGIVILVSVVFYVMWRFHMFRVTVEHVEVRKGIVFRSHRRAPLDRVQGVNLTRPFLARLIGLSKLEVVGAGMDANVALEYLNTSIAEQLRADILRLASGARSERLKASAGSAVGTAGGLLESVKGGISGVVDGVDSTDVVSESLVKVPNGRIVGSQLITIAPWFVLGAFLVVGMVVLPVILDSGPEGWATSLGVALSLGITLVITFVFVTWSMISKNLRYSIAATTNGVRTTYGLLTTITETLPPGRVHAMELTQPLLWRGFGWWSVRINRMTGASASAQANSSQQQFNIALPVGTLEDVERVIGLMLPELPENDRELIFNYGVGAPTEGEPYRNMRRGVGWRRPLSWRRHGYALTDYALYLRRGKIWRKLAVLPLARLQSISISQGPIDRMQNVGWAQAHTVHGPVSGVVTGVDREQLQALLNDVASRSVRAATRDTSHRWAEVFEAVMAAQAAANEVAVESSEPPSE